MLKINRAGVIAGVVLYGLAGKGFAHGARATFARNAGCDDDNRRPWVALTSPVDGAKYIEPATIPLAAATSISKGQLTRVDFYDGTRLIGSATAAPYTFEWTNVAAGTYTISAKAYGPAGAIDPCGAVSVTVTLGDRTAPPRLIVFTAPPDHATAVTHYVFEVFTADANLDKDKPVATTDLGKPEPDARNEISVDRSAFFKALPPGRYVRVVKAIGPGGEARSAPVPLTIAAGKGGD